MISITSFVKGFFKGLRNGSTKKPLTITELPTPSPKVYNIDKIITGDLDKIDLKKEIDDKLPGNYDVESKFDFEPTLSESQGLELELLGSNLKLSQDEFFKRCSLIAGREIKNLSELYQIEYLELKRFFKDEQENSRTNG